MPTKPKPTKWESTNSPITPPKNSNLSSLDINHLKNQSEVLSSIPMKNTLNPSIGLKEVKSDQLKIKDNVDLAGLSPPLDHLNHSKPSLMEPSEISLNKNSSLVVP